MIQEVAPGVYVETGFHGANVGFVVTDEGVILIDTPLLPNDARLWLGEIRKRTGLRYLIDQWPIPPFEKPKADRRFKSSLNRVWNEMRADAEAKAARQEASGAAKDWNPIPSPERSEKPPSEQ